MKQNNPLNLSDKTIDKFARYYELICDFNSHTNITRITSKEDFWNKHIIDSLLPFEEEIEDGFKIADIGSGAGFPGIPLAIKYPNTEVTLVESSNKKTKFLNLVIEDLKLTNIKVLTIRAEELPKDIRETFDIATARAVAQTNVLVELLSAYIKVKGRLFLLKGPKVFEELQELKDGYKKLGLKTDSQKTFKIEGQERIILIFKKTKITSKEFPRRFSQMKRSPLK